MKLISTCLCLWLLSYISYAQEPFIYVSDAANFQNGPWKINKYTASGVFVEIFIDEKLGWPQDILFLDDQDVVLVSNLNTGKIERHHAQTGDWISTFAAGISGPTRMAIGPDSLLYVLQWTGDNKVLRYGLDGSSLGAFTSTGTPASIGLDWNTAGHLYVSSYNQDRVDCFDTAGNLIGTCIDSALVGPTNIWFGANDTLFVLDYDGNALKSFDANGQYIATHVSGLSQSEGIAYMPDGTRLIGNGGTGSVKQYDAHWNYLGDLIAPGKGALIRPNAVVVHLETDTSDTGSTTSVASPKDKEYHVVPISDREFYVNKKLPISSDIGVFDIEGKRIATGNPSTMLLWNAKNAAPGVYIIQATTDEGVILRRKVVIP